MSSFIQGTGYDLKHLSDNYPWSELGTATVVDVSPLPPPLSLPQPTPPPAPL